jgi:hypothetical protein
MQGNSQQLKPGACIPPLDQTFPRGNMHPKQYLSRKEASEYLKACGLPVAVATLAKYATVGGGPEFCSFGRFPRYSIDGLHAWIGVKLSKPRRSTSESKEADDPLIAAAFGLTVEIEPETKTTPTPLIPDKPARSQRLTGQDGQCLPTPVPLSACAPDNPPPDPKHE